MFFNAGGGVGVGVGVGAAWGGGGACDGNVGEGSTERTEAGRWEGTRVVNTPGEG